MIEDVEELGAKLEARALGKREVFSDAEIHLPSARPAEQIARRGAEFPSRSGKRRGIDPLRDVFAPWRSERNAGNQIGTLGARGPVRRSVTAGHQHIHREAGASEGGRSLLPSCPAIALAIPLSLHSGLPRPKGSS